MNATMKQSWVAVSCVAMVSTLSACATVAPETAAMTPAPTPTSAEQASTPSDSTRAFSEEIGQIALAAVERLNADDPAGVVAIVNETLARDVSNYERYMLLNLRADASYQLDDIPGAIQDWQTMLELGVARPDEAAALSVNIGQMMILQGRTDEGVARLEGWLAENPPREPIVFLIASALAEDGQYNRSLPYAALAEDLAAKVEHKHLDLLAYLYGELEMPEQRERTLRRKETEPSLTLHPPD